MSKSCMGRFTFMNKHVTNVGYWACIRYSWNNTKKVCIRVSNQAIAEEQWECSVAKSSSVNDLKERWPALFDAPQVIIFPLDNLQYVLFWSKLYRTCSDNFCFLNSWFICIKTKESPPSSWRQLSWQSYFPKIMLFLYCKDEYSAHTEHDAWSMNQ